MECVCPKMMGEDFVEDLNLIIKGQVRLLISGHWELLRVYVQRRVKKLRLE